MKIFSCLSNIFFRCTAKFAARVASCCETGLVRSENQDSIYVDADKIAFCVADGMGGGQGGGEASKIAKRCFVEALEKEIAFPVRLKRVYDAMLKANSEIRCVAKDKNYSHMASTFVAFLVNAMTGEGVIGYVGDSRVYLYRDGVLKQLTRDHTLATELAQRTAEACNVDKLERFSHILTRALGTESDVFPEWRKADVKDGDWFMLCSDGLYNMMESSSIASAFENAASPDDVLRALCANVVAGGATDNYSAIVVKIEACR